MLRKVNTSVNTREIINPIPQPASIEAVAKTESDVMYKLDKSLRAYVDNGEAMPDEAMDSHRSEARKYGISGARFNDLLFTSVKRLGDEGYYGIYETLKKSRPDGTPGMYSIPAWKEKIDAAQIHSQNVFLTKVAHSRKTQ